MNSAMRYSARRLAHAFRRVFGGLPIYLVSHRPLVVVSYWADFYGNASKIRDQLPGDEPLFAFFQLGWEAESDERVSTIRGQLEEVRERIPRFTPFFLANSPSEERALRAAGLAAAYCNQNAFLDWTRYKTRSNTNPTYDALYLARITPFKRHLLAREIKSLHLIGAYRESEADYAKGVLAQVSPTKWTKKVDSRSVAREIQKARVGLCLSEVEGAMFVSLEYLLSGRPVVSTRSTGGRDTFFNNAGALIVDDTPAAVAEGVREMISRNVDMREVREQCIDLMLEHRARFSQLVQDIFDRQSERQDFANQWEQVFTHKLALRCGPDGTASARRLPIRGMPIDWLRSSSNA